MPATQGYRLEEWHEPPALTGSHELKSQPTEVRVSNYEQCVEFVLLQGLQEIDAYSGYSDLQLDVAKDISDQIFEPEKDILKALSQYLSDSTHVESSAKNLDNSVRPEPLGKVLEMPTKYVVSRYDVETGKLLPFIKEA